MLVRGTDRSAHELVDETRLSDPRRTHHCYATTFARRSNRLGDGFEPLERRCSSEEGGRRVDVRLSRTEGLDRVFTTKKVDALLAPSGGPAWLTDLVNGDYGTGGSSGPAAVAGYPSITVPAGFVRGLPVGVSFIGPAWSEARLIGIAYAYEQQSKLRRAPQYLPGALV